MQKNVNQDHEIRSLVLNWMKECTIFVLNRVSDWRPRESGSPGAHLYSKFPWMPPTQALSLLPFSFLSPSLLVFTHFLFFILGSLRCHNSNGNQNLKKSNRLNRQNNNSAHSACFLYINFLLCLCMTTMMKMPSFTFYGPDVKERRQNFLSLSELGYDWKEFSFRIARLHLTK